MNFSDIIKPSDWPEFAEQRPDTRVCTLTLELKRLEVEPYLKMLCAWLLDAQSNQHSSLPKEVTIAPGVVLHDVMVLEAITMDPQEWATGHGETRRAFTHCNVTLKYHQYER